MSFKRRERKDDVVADYRRQFVDDEGVVVIGVAQERAYSYKASKRTGPHGGVSFDFSRQSVAVNHYYFYLQDRQWGPGFIKVCTYMPYPVKLCLNGHDAWGVKGGQRKRLAPRLRLLPPFRQPRPGACWLSTASLGPDAR